MNPWMFLNNIFSTITGVIAFVFQAVGLVGLLLCVGVAIYKGYEKLLEEQ